MNILKINNIYMVNDHKIPLKSILEAYKKGEDVFIEDECGADITQVEFVKHLFGGVIDWDYFSSLIDENDLDSMIFAGSFEVWNTRRLQRNPR